MKQNTLETLALSLVACVAIFLGANINEKYNINGKTVGLTKYSIRQELIIPEGNKLKIFGDSWKNGTLNYVRIEEGKKAREYKMGELTEEQRAELQDQFDTYMTEIRKEKLRNKGFFKDFK
jgi:hypothetical protein